MLPGTLSVTYAAIGARVEGPGHQVLQPINADGTSVFKQGSTVPVKFRVCDVSGVAISPSAVVAGFRLIEVRSGTVIDHVDEQVVSTTPYTEFRWSADERQWIFNLGTKPLDRKKTYIYEIALADGTSIRFQFGLR